MANFLKLFVLGLVALITMDIVWLGVIMKSFYAIQLGPIGRMVNGELSPDWTSVIGAWILIVVGSVVFVVPRIRQGSILYTFCMGGLYGLIVYGVYDLTNYATLAQWPWAMVVVDVAWGVIANGLLAVILHLIV